MCVRVALLHGSSMAPARRREQGALQKTTLQQLPADTRVLRVLRATNLVALNL